MPNDNMIFDIYDFIRKGEWYDSGLRIWTFEYEDQQLYIIPKTSNCEFCKGDGEVFDRNGLALHECIECAGHGYMIDDFDEREIMNLDEMQAYRRQFSRLMARYGRVPKSITDFWER